MATPRGKIVRRFGINIYGNPKFDRLLGKRPNGPGVQGASRTRKKVSEYGQQLIEKQKVKLTYGLSEKQFRGLYQRAFRMSGITGQNIFVLLESRLDNAVYRLGMAATRPAARQLVVHGHVKVNGRRVSAPNFHLRPGDVITAKSSKRSQTMIMRNLEEAASRSVPEWLSLTKEQLRGEVLREPHTNDFEQFADIQKVVELYSK